MSESNQCIEQWLERNIINHPPADRQLRSNLPVELYRWGWQTTWHHTTMANVYVRYLEPNGN